MFLIQFIKKNCFRLDENKCKGDFLEYILPEGAGILPETSSSDLRHQTEFNSSDYHHQMLMNNSTKPIEGRILQLAIGTN